MQGLKLLRRQVAFSRKHLNWISTKSFVILHLNLQFLMLNFSFSFLTFLLQEL